MIDMIRQELPTLWVVPNAIVQSRLRFGHNIFDSDWDALIILDACRVDALREVAGKFSFIGNVESKWSRGSTSKEWIENTFVEENRNEVSQTAYVSANSFARELQWDELDRLDYLASSESNLTELKFLEWLVKHDQLRADDFLLYDSLWDKMVGDIDYTEIHPQVVTDRAIDAGRDLNPERLIVHYMQPHHPFIYPDELDEIHHSPFQHLSEDGGQERVWEAYLHNLEFVLDYVGTLLDNLDAETVVITADHGELFGNYLKSHPMGVLHPKLRKVPWITTTATDSGTHETDEYQLRDELSESETKDRLAALGYI